MVSLFSTNILLYDTVKIRLFQFQKRLGMNKFPLCQWNHPLQKIWKFNYIAMIMGMIYNVNGCINVKVNNELINSINPNLHPFAHLINPKDTLKNGVQLFNHHILFIE